MEIMKKFMILMLSLAVLFSFAACDNSSPAVDDDDDQTVVETNDYAKRAVEEVNAVLNGAFTDSTGFFYAGKAVMTDGKYSDDYTADVVAGTVTYSKHDDNAVAGLAETYTTVTLSGVDITEDDAPATEKTILLTSYTIDFSKDPEANNGVYGSLDPVSGKITGNVIGMITFEDLTSTGAIGEETTITVKAATTSDPAVAATGISAKVVAFLPDDPAAQSVTFCGTKLDSEDLVAYLNSNRTNDVVKDYVVASTVITSNAKYKAYWAESQFGETVYTNLMADVVQLAADGLKNLVLDTDMVGRTTQYTEGSTTTPSTAVITFTNSDPDNPMQFATDGTDLVYAIPVGGSISVTLEGKAGATKGSFSATDFSVNGRLDVYKHASPVVMNDTTLNADYKYVDIDGLTGKFKTPVTVTQGAKENGVDTATIDSALAFAEATNIDGTINTEINAKVMPGTAGTGEDTTLAALGVIAIDCAKASK